MNKLLIPDLNINDLCPIFYDLSPAEAEDIFGGGFVTGYPNIYISTIHGDVNGVTTTYEGAYNIHDNKYYTTDYSRTTYIWIAR
jgi:hypothetical protein